MGQIFGIISTTSRKDLESELAKIEAHLNFWQADAQDRYVDPHAAIGNRLLYNTPESMQEHLPLLCPEGRHVLSCVARLDNREELAERLGYLPADAADKPDGQFILDAFLKWKEACVQHFIGDFAIAVWDNVDQTLFLARDHIGVKPLFYARTEDFFIFASDIHAFKSHCRLEEHINEIYLARTLARVPNPSPDTFYTNITRLMPAQSHILKNGQLQSKTYWSLEPSHDPALKTEADYYARFRELLQESVSCRVRTTRNIGCELSGGLDSSAITMLAARALEPDLSRLHTLSYIMPDEAKPFDDDWVDEEPEQEATIAGSHIPRENVHKLTRTFFDNPLDELDYATEVNAGISDTDCFWTEALRRRAKEVGVGVILSGFPGDEAVSCSGGAWYFDLLARREYRTILALVRERPVERLKGIASYFIKKYIKKPEHAGLITQQEISNLLSPGFKKDGIRFVHAQPFFVERNAFLKSRISKPHTCLRMENEGCYALRCRMETRYPFADIRLLQFVLSIPPIFNKDAPRTRHLFRTATEGILPDKVRLRENKKGAPLVFHRFKFLNDAKILISHYQQPERFRHLLNNPKFLSMIQQTIEGSPTELGPSMRLGFWMSRVVNNKS